MRYSSELTINLRYLEENYRSLKHLAPNNQVIFMIKANAYGHGLEEMARFATNQLGIQSFGVASVGEAMVLRKNHPDLNCELLVFSDTEILDKKYKECYLDYNIIPVIHSLAQLTSILGDVDFKYLPLVIKFDTGMHRLGILEEQIEKVIELLKAKGRTTIYHLMTHFSSSYIKSKEGDRTQRQVESFERIKARLGDAGIVFEHSSSANSGAIEQNIGLNESHIRPGLMLYGPQSFFGTKTTWKGKCVSSLSSAIIKKDIVKRGTPIGYGGHVVNEDGVVVHIPIGYGDGFLTYYQGLKLMHNGCECQVLGRVNMDMTALFFKLKDADKVAIGDSVTLWGHDQNSISDFSIQTKTIPYQIFTAITSRVPRSYRYQ